MMNKSTFRKALEEVRTRDFNENRKFIEDVTFFGKFKFYLQ